MTRRPHRRGIAPGRPGAILSTELLFILPVLLLILLALVEFAFLVGGETRVQAASREGARVAALGGSPSDVNAAVKLVLGDKVYGDPNTKVDIIYPNMTANPGDPVQVVVSVKANVVAPNIFAPLFDLSKITLTGKTTMILE